jgi:hypothetical protein
MAVERMSVQRLNELLAIVMERRRAAGQSLSNWGVDERSVRAQTDRLLGMAEYEAQLKLHRRYQDEALADLPADRIIAEWDDELPTLQGHDRRLIEAGWGRDRMAAMLWRGNLRKPHDPEHMQPIYTDTCQFCYRPITKNGSLWKDHGGNQCPDRFDGVYDGNHVPVGEDVDDEYDEDDL